MKVTIKADENAIERMADARALNRAQAQVLFGFSASDLDGPTIEAILDLALSLSLDVSLKNRVIEINA